MANPRRYILFLLLLIALGLVTRLGSFAYVYSRDPTRILNPDSETYNNPARALVELGRFAASPATPQKPEVMRTPGYPVFIAAHYLLFGQRHGPVIVSQILISLATVLMTFYLGRHLAGPMAGLIAAALLLIEPVSFLNSQLLLTETLFTFFLMLIVWTGMKAMMRRDRPVLWPLLLGASLALSAHVRPISYYLILPMLIGLVVVWRIQGAGIRAMTLGAAVCLLPWIVLVGGWQVRNARVAGRPDFSYIQSQSILWYRGAGIIALRDGISLAQAQEGLKKEVGEMDDQPIAQFCARCQREGSRLIREHPALFVRETWNGLKSLMLSLPGGTMRDFYGLPRQASPIRDLRTMPLNGFVRRWVLDQPGLLLLSLFIFVNIGLLYLGLAFIPWRSLIADRPQRAVHVMLAGIMFYITIVSAGPETYFRFRVPLIPLLAIYAGWGYTALGRWIVKKIHSGG